ncbi:MAG: hypothetical protein ABIT58_02510 [Ferruginibacter sp.]
MERVHELNSEIIALSLKIKNDYPELSKYLDEMPVTIPDSDDPSININNLEKYRDSLINLLSKYKESHVSNDEKKTK